MGLYFITIGNHGNINVRVFLSASIDAFNPIHRLTVSLSSRCSTAETVGKNAHFSTVEG